MAHAHTFIRKGDIPMAKILSTILRFIFQIFPSKCTVLSFLTKWLTTHTIPINCEITVAVAAPLIPHSKWKIKIGARMMLATTVTIECCSVTSKSSSPLSIISNVSCYSSRCRYLSTTRCSCKPTLKCISVLSISSSCRSR